MSDGFFFLFHIEAFDRSSAAFHDNHGLGERISEDDPIERLTGLIVSFSRQVCSGYAEDEGEEEPVLEVLTYQLVMVEIDRENLF